MSLDRDCSLRIKEDYEKAESLFKPLEKITADFTEQHNLFVDKWYHEGQTILLREKDNIDILNFKGVQRQINLVFNIAANELLLTITAYQDIKERKLRNICIVNFCLPTTQEKFFHYLDIAWRAVSFIKEEELLSQDAWPEDAIKQATALGIDYWY